MPKVENQPNNDVIKKHHSRIEKSQILRRKQQQMSQEEIEPSAFGYSAKIATNVLSLNEQNNTAEEKKETTQKMKMKATEEEVDTVHYQKAVEALNRLKANERWNENSDKNTRLRKNKPAVGIVPEQ